MSKKKCRIKIVEEINIEEKISMEKMSKKKSRKKECRLEKMSTKGSKKLSKDWLFKCSLKREIFIEINKRILIQINFIKNHYDDYKMFKKFIFFSRLTMTVGVIIEQHPILDYCIVDIDSSAVFQFLFVMMDLFVVQCLHWFEHRYV